MAVGVVVRDGVGLDARECGCGVPGTLSGTDAGVGGRLQAGEGCRNFRKI
jgi:hypothetical protein